MNNERFTMVLCALAGVAITAFLSGASRAQQAKDAATSHARPSPPDFRRTLAKG